MEETLIPDAFFLFCVVGLMAPLYDVSGLLSPLALQICNMLNAPADEYFTFQVTLPSARSCPSTREEGSSTLLPSLLSPGSMLDSQTKKNNNNSEAFGKYPNAKFYGPGYKCFCNSEKVNFHMAKKVREGFRIET